MKPNIKYVALAFMAFAMLGLGSCKEAESLAPAGLSATTIQGNWAITTAFGAEWTKGVGITTPKAPETDMVGLKVEISATTVTVKDISGAAILPATTYTFDATAKTILIGPNGNTGLGMFKINDFELGISMAWDQRDPIDADYRPEAGCGCELYYQKFWTLSKMP
jgi:hypothetical protein